MARPLPIPSEFSTLSPTEQLDYILTLWEAMGVNRDALPVPDWHRQELANAIGDAVEGTAGYRPWSEVLAELTRKR